jgi:hypothetical protein
MKSGVRHNQELYQLYWALEITTTVAQGCEGQGSYKE